MPWLRASARTTGETTGTTCGRGGVTAVARGGSSVVAWEARGRRPACAVVPYPTSTAPEPLEVAGASAVSSSTSISGAPTRMFSPSAP